MSTLATYIRDQTYQRLTTGPINNNWKTSRKVPVPTLQQDQLPSLAVYIMREQIDANGDANVVGVTNYMNQLTLGISVFESADKAELLDGAMDPLVDLIENTLLQDITYVNLRWTDGTTQIIEAFPTITRLYSFPNNGEFYLMECRLQITVEFRSQYLPITPTALTDVDVTVEPFDGSVQSGNYVSDIVLPQS